MGCDDDVAFGDAGRKLGSVIDVGALQPPPAGFRKGAAAAGEPIADKMTTGIVVAVDFAHLGRWESDVGGVWMDALSDPNR